MNKIIDRDRLQPRLVKDFSNGLSVYDVDKLEFPELYEEITRISSFEFGISDSRDQFDDTYRYLVCVGSSDDIVSYYRYILCKDAISSNEVHLSTGKYYHYTREFVKEFLPYTIEFGRSVVNTQSATIRSNSHAGLKAIWSGGLGPLIHYHRKNSGIRYLFGQVSLQERDYPMDEVSQDSLYAIISCFMTDFGQQEKNLIVPKNVVINDVDLEAYNKMKGYPFTGDYNKDCRTLRKLLKDNHSHRPPLFFHYANMVREKQDGMSMFLPVSNPLLHCYEMGILIDFDKVSQNYIDEFCKDDYNPDVFKR